MVALGKACFRGPEMRIAGFMGVVIGVFILLATLVQAQAPVAGGAEKKGEVLLPADGRIVTTVNGNYNNVAVWQSHQYTFNYYVRGGGCHGGGVSYGCYGGSAGHGTVYPVSYQHTVSWPTNGQGSAVTNSHGSVFAPTQVQSQNTAPQPAVDPKKKAEKVSDAGNAIGDQFGGAAPVGLACLLVGGVVSIFGGRRNGSQSQMPQPYKFTDVDVG